MKNVLVPIFDEFNKYSFVKNVEVKIHNKPTHADYQKITRLLPGFCQGYVRLERLLTDGKIEVRDFYDARQNTSKLKGFYVTINPH